MIEYPKIALIQTQNYTDFGDWRLTVSVFIKT